jgi:hypothetical protein
LILFNPVDPVDPVYPVYRLQYVPGLAYGQSSNEKIGGQTDGQLDEQAESLGIIQTGWHINRHVGRMVSRQTG